MSLYNPFQILYPCEKCGELEAGPERIGGATVTTRLCPGCVTRWGIYVRTLQVWMHYLEADWQERRAVDVGTARHALVDCRRYREELCSIALRWLGRDEGAVQERAAWELERGSAVSVLRGICGEFGDNDWPDNLHLVDILEKHLEPHLEGEVP